MDNRGYYGNQGGYPMTPGYGPGPYNQPNTVVVKEESTPTQVEGKSPEQSQEQSQSQNKGNCAEKPGFFAFSTFNFGT